MKPPRSLTLWPGGLVGRVILVLLAAVGLEFAGSTLLYEQTNALLPSAETLDALAGRLVRAERVLATLAPELRDGAAQAVSGDGLRLSWRAGSSGPDAGSAGRMTLPLTLLRGQLTRLRPELAAADLYLDTGAQAGDGLFRDVAGTLRLRDGTALAFHAERLISTRTTLYDVLLSTALFAGGVLLAAAMIVHTLAAPLRRLARVAGEIGGGPLVYVAEKRGPREVRQVARALNAMQARISTMVRDRTEALAAVSHDLRTPIARMRLRAETLGGGETVQAIQGDLAEMEQMIGAVLAFLNGQNDPEPRRTVDLVSIVRTLVDDAADAGADATYAGLERCRIEARPLEVKRAVRNLIDNAVTYGGTARVSVSDAAALDGRPAVCVRVEDDGPGIADAELERVFEPFHRVDRSRGAGLGGIGLGLAIVRQVVSRDGGRAVLRNRPQGGLCAEIVLPIGSSRADMF